MASLIDIFFAELRAPHEDLSKNATRVEAMLARLVAEGTTAWPSVALDGERFVSHLARSVAEGRDLAAVHATDLFLACACAHGDRAALAALDEQFLAKLDRHIASVHAAPAFIDDVRQRLRELLFVGARDKPKIADYSGHGPLLKWLRVVAIRTALNLRRGHAASAFADDFEPDVVDVAANGPDPELDYLKARCRAEFKTAFLAALGNLSAKERTAIRIHHLDGLTLEETARVCRVSRATVARWLAEARARILRDTQASLTERLRLNRQEMESVLRIIDSQFDVSIHRYLEAP